MTAPRLPICLRALISSFIAFVLLLAVFCGCGLGLLVLSIKGAEAVMR